MARKTKAEKAAYDAGYDAGWHSVSEKAIAIMGVVTKLPLERHGEVLKAWQAVQANRSVARLTFEEIRTIIDTVVEALHHG